MKIALSVIAILVLMLFAALAATIMFPDRFAADLPDWARPGWAQPWLMPRGTQLVLQLEPDGVELGQAVEESIRISRRRLHDVGIRAVVEKQDADRIVVRLPATADVKDSIGIMLPRGRFEVRLIDETMTPEQAMRGRFPLGSELLNDANGGRYLVKERVLLTGRDLADARAAISERTSEPVINLRFNAAGTRKFAQVTQENVEHKIACVFDRVVLWAPVVREPILGGAVPISPNFSVRATNELAVLLRAGELPGRLIPLEARRP